MQSVTTLNKFDTPTAVSCIVAMPNQPGNFLTGDARSGVIRLWNVSQQYVSKDFTM